MREPTIISVALIALVFAAATSSAQNPDRADVMPEEFGGVGIEERLGDYVPLGLEFTNEQGETVKLREYYDGKRPVILSLVYYSCTSICNPMLNGMVDTLRQVDYSIGKDFDVVTVSISPEETPEVASARKRGFLEIYGRESADAGWHFQTGKEDAISVLADAVGFGYRYDEETKQYAHGAALIFTSPDGRIARYLGGVMFQPRDVRLALLEAAQGKIGSPFDQLFFFCFHYDPSTGTYTAAVLNIVRVVGALTVILLGALIMRLLLKDRRGRKDTEAAANEIDESQSEDIPGPTPVIPALLNHAALTSGPIGSRREP